METLLRVARECPQKTTTTAAVADTPASSGLETLAQQSTTSISPSSSSPPHDPSQPAAVHALNILRALYRDSRLGEHIVPFIPEGVMIAIEGFSAPLWPVSRKRNQKRESHIALLLLGNRFVGKKFLHAAVQCLGDENIWSQASAGWTLDGEQNDRQGVLYKISNSSPLSPKAAWGRSQADGNEQRRVSHFCLVVLWILLLLICCCAVSALCSHLCFQFFSFSLVSTPLPLMKPTHPSPWSPFSPCSSGQQIHYCTNMARHYFRMLLRGLDKITPCPLT